MPKDDIRLYIEIVGGIAGYLFTRALAGYNSIRDEWKVLKHKQVLQEQSLKRAWEEIDKIKSKVPHGGEI